MRKLIFIPLFLLLALLLTACGGDEATPIPPPPTQAVAANVQPTPTTAVPPTNTSQPPPPPTIASPPTLTPVPEPTATATPDAIILMAQADFGDGRNPLTGEEISDPDLLNRRPIACKLSNFPASYTRPQSGINSADILFEHITEGALTRFTAIFYGQTPDTVGPIRSARLIDLELPEMYDAALCFSGAGIGVSQKIYASSFRPRVLNTSTKGYYRTGDESKPFEHTLYARPDQLWDALGELGENRRPTLSNSMHFSSEPPQGGQEAAVIYIDYPAEDVRWEYNAENGRYYRWSDDVPHLDGATQEQMNFKNVVFAVVSTVTTDICEQVDANNQCVALSLEIQLWGSGPAVIFRDGRRYDGNWLRQGDFDMLTFIDFDGNPIPLQIGNTAVQLMPHYVDNPIESRP